VRGAQGSLCFLLAVWPEGRSAVSLGQHSEQIVVLLYDGNWMPGKQLLSEEALSQTAAVAIVPLYLGAQLAH